MISIKMFNFLYIFVLLGITISIVSCFSLTTAIVDGLVNSPLYKPIVGKARDTLVKTAEAAGIPWSTISNRLKNSRNWLEEVDRIQSEYSNIPVPEYFKEKFHGYEYGNLCLDAAIEQEVASAAVGTRNFPGYGTNGDEIFRQKYDQQLKFLGAAVEEGGVVVDMGCGVGSTSTWRLAKLYPQASKIIGLDLSPHFVAVARHLLEFGSSMQFSPDVKSRNDGDSSSNENSYVRDPRISFELADITRTSLASNSVSLVSICLVMHELPTLAAVEVIRESYRVLKPGGCLAIMELDPTSPGLQKLQQNPFLFSIFRSTEPFLGEYVQYAPNLPNLLQTEGFGTIRTSAATARHLAMVAVKPGIVDYRPPAAERAETDEHLRTWSVKKN